MKFLRRNRYRSLFLFLVVFVILVLFVSVNKSNSSFLVTDMMYWLKKSNATAVSINDQQVIGQVFKGNFENLSRISVLVSGVKANQPIELVLFLCILNRRGTILREVSQKLTHAKNESFIDFVRHKFNFIKNESNELLVDFDFEPIVDSKNITFYFYLKTNHGKESNEARVYYSKDKFARITTNGSLRINHTVHQGDLFFKTQSRFIFDFPTIQSNLLRQLKQDPIFAFCFFIVMCSCIIGLIYFEWKSLKKPSS
jgi:hypothetical protein